MTVLRKLKSKPTLSDEFLQSANPGPLFPESDAQNTVLLEEEIPLRELDKVIQKYMKLSAKGGENDQAFAIDLHKALPLSTSVAANKEIWWWLAVCKYPQYVAHRWHNNQVPLNRYIGIQVKQVFSRLWWMAQLTKQDGDDYTITNTLMEFKDSQDVFEHLYGRSFYRYPEALMAWIEVVDKAGVGTTAMRPVRNEAFLTFNCMISTLVLESLSYDDLCKRAGEIIATIKLKMES